MKKLIDKIGKHNLMVIIVATLIVILIIVGIILASKIGKKENPGDMSDGYDISDQVVNAPGTKVITNDNLDAMKCLEGICISKVNVYANDDHGRVECNVTNNNTEVQSGYIRVRINNAAVTVAYRNLAPGETRSAYAAWGGKEVVSVDDYSLEKLTQEELDAIK